MNVNLMKRMKEFVLYHIKGDGECNNVVLKAWADIHCHSSQEKYELAYFFSITYCVESAIVCFYQREKIWADIDAWVDQNKSKIVFQSDRKYIKMKDSFQRCLHNFKDNLRLCDDFMARVTINGVISLKKAIPYVSSWELFGRFSAFLFLETFVELTGYRIENTTIEWKKGNTATSGLLNLFTLDAEANAFDEKGKLRRSQQDMDSMLASLICFIKNDGGDTNVTKIETSLCAYRKFFKGSRYNGFYLDRMLEEIYTMKSDFPEISAELFDIRRACFPVEYLGEIGGWRGIRKNMKKYYLQTNKVLYLEGADFYG